MMSEELRKTIMDAMRSVSERADEFKAGCATFDGEWPDAEDKAIYDAEVALVDRLRVALAALSDAAQAPIARTLNDWHEDYGNVVWFTWQDGEWLGEPSYIGQPNDSDWPGYHTHWTPHPTFPTHPDAAPVAAQATAPSDHSQCCDTPALCSSVRRCTACDAGVCSAHREQPTERAALEVAYRAYCGKSHADDTEQHESMAFDFEAGWQARATAPQGDKQ